MKGFWANRHVKATQSDLQILRHRPVASRFAPQCLSELEKAVCVILSSSFTVKTPSSSDQTMAASTLTSLVAAVVYFFSGVSEQSLLILPPLYP